MAICFRLVVLKGGALRASSVLLFKHGALLLYAHSLLARQGNTHAKNTIARTPPI